MAVDELGALTNISDIGGDGIYRFPVYQTQTNLPEVNQQQLQNLYGSSQMPVFQWISKIQTGEKTYDPATEGQLFKEYEDLYNAGEIPPGFKTPGEIAKEVARDVTQSAVIGAASGIGKAFTDPYLADTGAKFSDKVFEGAKSGLGFGELPSETITKNFDISDKQFDVIKNRNLFYDPELATLDAAKAAGRVDDFNRLNRVVKGKQVVDTGTGTGVKKVNVSNRENIGTADNPQYAYRNETAGGKLTASRSNTIDYSDFAGSNKAQPPGYFDRVGDRLKGGEGNVGGSVGAGVGVFFTDLLFTKGKDPEKSAKKAVGATVGTYIGNALLPGFGGVIGGTIGAAVGGRVICNELSRQNLMTRQQVVLDYKFTRDYLTPTHVNGYHCWAVWMVKQMRKGRFVKFWKHVAGHRANEIAYIYKKRNKPDYLGKIYRKILEPTCYVIGLFCKTTDWSVLYRKKEI